MNAYFMILTVNGVGVTVVAKDAAGSSFAVSSVTHPEPVVFAGFRASLEDPAFSYLDTTMFRDQILVAAEKNK